MEYISCLRKKQSEIGIILAIYRINFAEYDRIATNSYGVLEMISSGNEWVCGPDTSEEMRKLLNSLDYCTASKTEIEKHQRKVRLQKVKDQPYIVSTPSFCYAYVLYKLRKLSGLNQDEMSARIGMSKSTYAKIENRFATVDIDTLHLTMYSFGINPKEFADLYWHVQGLVQISGRFFIPAKMSNFNSENVIYNDNNDLVYEQCTPINLYDKKVKKEYLEKLDLKFHEIILEGKKRIIEMEEKEQQIESNLLNE